MIETFTAILIFYLKLNYVLGYNLLLICSQHHIFLNNYGHNAVEKVSEGITIF
jgi:hypothetical protein